MWIVKLALTRPYTFVVFALLIFVLSPLVILRTPTDIFPNIDIPVISVAWTYTGLNPEDIEGRLTTPYEKVLTTLVDNIEHIESTSYNGAAVIKIFLQPHASVDRANSQVVSASQFAASIAAIEYSTAGDYQFQRFERTDSSTWTLRSGSLRTTIE